MDTVEEGNEIKSRPIYVRPTITVMDRDEVLKAFQMTAAEISAAGCWWSPMCPNPDPS